MHFTNLSLSALYLVAATTLATPTPAPPTSHSTARTLQSEDGLLWCGIFATGAKSTAKGLLWDLYGGKIHLKQFTVPAGACERVHCWDTTAVYVCNDAATPVTLIGNDIWNAVHPVNTNCCHGFTSFYLEEGPYTSGQKFIRDAAKGWNWNAVLAYGNCQASKNIRPSEAGGQGVNGACLGGNSDPEHSDDWSS